MRIGRRVAFDIGKARIGVAVSDAHGILASPRDFIPRNPDISETISAITNLIASEEPLEVYIGLPVNLKNQPTESTTDAIELARKLQGVISQTVRLIDERMTTRIASSAMASAGKSSRQQRGSIDSAAAAVILETALGFEKSTGQEPGITIGDYEIGK
ncbi:MAG: Holliday junction resolvase RuvX [Micrococcales bacterium]